MKQKNNTEAHLQLQVCDWLKIQHKGIIFMADLASGTKLTMGQAVRNKRMRSQRGLPDLFIAEPRGNRHGLFLELKREGTTVILKDGTLTKDAHIREQAAVLADLRQRGYEAKFGIGFDQSTDIINEYLNQ